MSTAQDSEVRPARASLVYGFLLTGTALIVGGESLCFFGPESHARLRDVVCHIIFYCGIISVLAGIASRMRRTR